MMTPKICEKCQKLTKPLISASHPSASEWYCEPCHASYQMTPAEVAAVKMAMRPQSASVN
jgi:hypothetical protein